MWFHLAFDSCVVPALLPASSEHSPRLSSPRLSSPRRLGIADGVNPTGLAVDSLRGRVFWTDPGAPAIMSCGLDGSDTQEIAGGTFGHQMKDGPLGISVDTSTDTVMWSAAGNTAIRRADITRDSEVSTVTLGDTSSWSASGPWGIASYLRPGCASAGAVPTREEGTGPDFGLGRVYWTNWGRIQCCEIGSGRVSDVVRGLVDPTGIVIDRKHGRLFWTDPKAGKVQCSSLDGTRICDVATGQSAPWGLALGPTHIFWTDRAEGAVYSCCHKSGSVRRVIDGLQTPEGIALHNGPPSSRHRLNSAVQPVRSATPKQWQNARPKEWRNSPPKQWRNSRPEGAASEPGRPRNVQDIMRQSELTLQRIKRTDNFGRSL